jgi:hypothetical protein
MLTDACLCKCRLWWLLFIITKVCVSLVSGSRCSKVWPLQTTIILGSLAFANLILLMDYDEKLLTQILTMGFSRIWRWWLVRHNSDLLEAAVFLPTCGRWPITCACKLDNKMLQVWLEWRYIPTEQWPQIYVKIGARMIQRLRRRTGLDRPQSYWESIALSQTTPSKVQ